MEQCPEKNCKSIFKNGEEGISREEFTRMWIRLIGLAEKNKHVKNSVNEYTEKS